MDYRVPSGYVYSSNLARAYAQPAYEPAYEPARPQPAPPRPRQPAPRPRPRYRVRPETRTGLSLGKKLMTMGSIAVFFAALMFLLVRYERISVEYGMINDLKSQIGKTQLELSSLLVELEFTASLDQAKQEALAAGMNYPAASQILRPGDIKGEGD